MLVAGIDYYINEQGYWVFTQKYLLERGYCCKNGCKHCPLQLPKSQRQPRAMTTQNSSSSLDLLP
ncbi:MAG: hypothetical protein IPL33_18530 [Sphingobacteriales bacterium]|nr:hypothetical protein [Sphingobacteriales bacterium]